MKKIGLLFVAIVMMMLFAFSASALEETGQCGDNVYWTFDESTGELIISGEGDMWDYTSGKSPFAYSNIIEKVVIEKGVTSIGDNAFHYAQGMYGISIADGVTEIGVCAFEMCKSLVSVSLPDSVTNFGKGAFYSCIGLKNINIPYGTERIVDFMFAGTAIEKIWIPDSVVSIGLNAFHGCEYLQSVKMSKNIRSIGDYAFAFCSFKEIIIPDTVINIGEGAFNECKKLESIKLPKDLTNIAYGMFYLCENIKNFEVPSNVVDIDSAVFVNCTSLESIIIPDSVESIGMGAFYLCSDLSDVYYSGSEEQWKKITIDYELNEALSEATIHFNYSIHTHNYTVCEVVEPTCMQKGYTVYICECGDTYSDDFTEITTHNMNSNICDICGEECFCICHAKTLGAFIYRLFKIIDSIFDTNIIFKVFDITDICNCGIIH